MSFDKDFKGLKTNLRREPWLAVSSILVMTLTFLSLNSFIFLLAGSNVIMKYLEDKAQVTIFFSDASTEESILKVKSNIEADARVSSVKYVSKDEALSVFREISKDEPTLFESLETNPLPASLEVKAKRISELEALSVEFSKLEGAEDVKFYKDVVDNFRKWSTNIRVGAFTLLAVLSVVSVVMILMTIGVTIHSKGIEVEIMKLVGATDKYVKGPLVMQGMFYGIVASIISLFVMYCVVLIFSPVINSFFRVVSAPGNLNFWTGLFWLPVLSGSSSLLNKVLSLVSLLGIEMVWGMLLGYVGAVLSIKKYLKY